MPWGLLLGVVFGVFSRVFLEGLFEAFRELLGVFFV